MLFYGMSPVLVLHVEDGGGDHGGREGDKEPAAQGTRCVDIKQCSFLVDADKLSVFPFWVELCFRNVYSPQTVQTWKRHYQ